MKVVSVLDDELGEQLKRSVILSPSEEEVVVEHPQRSLAQEPVILVEYGVAADGEQSSKVHLLISGVEGSGALKSSEELPEQTNVLWRSDEESVIISNQEWDPSLSHLVVSNNEEVGGWVWILVRFV